MLRNQGQVLGLQGAASHLVGRIPYFSVNKSLIWDVVQVSALLQVCALGGSTGECFVVV